MIDKANLSDQDLFDCAMHICYELKMLAKLPKELVRFEGESDGDLVNTCLESALGHARTLIEFLVGRPKREHGAIVPGTRVRSRLDMDPSMFAPTWTAKDPAAFDGYLDVIDKSLSHLSLERIKGANGPNWVLTDLADALIIVFRSFADSVDRSKPRIFTTFMSAATMADAQRTAGPKVWPQWKFETGDSVISIGGFSGGSFS